jgi:hypothetical protein
MTYHGVECERVAVSIPEAYICRWQDRFKLICGLLSEGKGTRLIDRPGIEQMKGITRHRYALIQVLGADEG